MEQYKCKNLRLQHLDALSSRLNLLVQTKKKCVIKFLEVVNWGLHYRDPLALLSSVETEI